MREPRWTPRAGPRRLGSGERGPVETAQVVRPLRLLRRPAVAPASGSMREPRAIAEGGAAGASRVAAPSATAPPVPNRGRGQPPRGGTDPTAGRRTGGLQRPGPPTPTSCGTRGSSAPPEGRREYEKCRKGGRAARAGGSRRAPPRSCASRSARGGRKRPHRDRRRAQRARQARGAPARAAPRPAAPPSRGRRGRLGA